MIIDLYESSSALNLRLVLVTSASASPMRAHWSKIFGPSLDSNQRWMTKANNLWKFVHARVITKNIWAIIFFQPIRTNERVNEISGKIPVCVDTECYSNCLVPIFNQRRSLRLSQWRQQQRRNRLWEVRVDTMKKKRIPDMSFVMQSPMGPWD